MIPGDILLYPARGFFRWLARFFTLAHCGHGDAGEIKLDEEDGMRFELKEEDRAKLSELYLRRQAILSDIERLQRMAQDTTLQIQTMQLWLAGKAFKEPKEAEIRPIFQDYQLVCLEVPDNWEKIEEGTNEQANREAPTV